MKSPKSNLKKIALWVIPALSLLFLPIACVLAGNAFFPAGVIYINSGGVKSFGLASSENSKATAIAYRSGIAGLSMITDQPGPHIIFAADGEFPAYTQWDVGSSAWSSIPQAAGQDMYEVLETYQGMNGWTGPSYVGGSHKVLIPADISDAAATPPDIIMEPIPTPVFSSNTQTSLSFQFNALADRNNIAPLGTWNDSIVSYTLYRSTNSTSSPVAVATIAQPAGGGSVVTYADSSVTQGVSYFYQLAVNFRWAAKTPNPWYETTARGPWSASMSSGAAVDSVKFMTSAISVSSGIKAGPITISAYNFASGNVGAVSSNVTLNLTSNSTGASSFYSYSAGACTATLITSATITTGQSAVSFCYSDTKSGSWTITATPTNAWSAISQANEQISVGPLDHFGLAFASPQTNDVTWTGTNTVTAQDIGGNTITNFSSQAITASLSVSNGATLANNTIASASFINGVANLTAQSFKYTGQTGAIAFIVTSSSGKVSTSTVTIAPGTLSTITIRDAVAGGGAVVSTRSLTVDSTLTLYAAGYDASGNFISNISGTWTAGSTLESAFTSPGSSIIFAPTLAPTSGIISFSDGAGHDAATGLITVTHGVLASFSLAGAVSAQNAGVSFDIGPITALDAKGNRVQSFSATVTVGDNSGSVTPVTSSVFTNGLLAGQMVAVTKATGGEVITVRDTSTNKSGSTNSFSVTHGVLHHFAVNFASPQVNDVVWTGTNTVIAQDQWNNSITDYDTTGSSVALSVSNGALLANNVLSAADFSSGVANLTVKNFKYTGLKGNTVFTATSAGKTGSAVVTISSGSVSSVSIRNGANNTGTVVSTKDMQVGESFVMYAAGYDISNNYITDVSGTWARTGTLDSPAGGTASSINYQPITAYTNGTITFNDGGGNTAETGTINVDRGPIDHFVLSFASPQVVGVPFSGADTLTAKDVGGNTITDYNTIGTTVTITTASPGSTLANNIFTASNFSAGVVNLNSLSFTYTGLAGNIVFVATSAGTLKTGTTTTLLNPGPLDHFSFNLTQAQLVNTAFTGTNTLTALDIGGNTITGFNPLVDNIAITYSPSVLGQNTVTGLEGPLGNVLAASNDFVNGVANLTGKLTHPGPGGGYTFVATSVSGKTGSSNGVDVDVGPLHHFGFEIIGNQVAGTPFSVKISAYAQDPQGIDHVKVSYVGNVVLTDTSGTALPVSIGPFINGEATVNVTVTKTTVGNILHVKDSTAQTIVGDSNAFDVGGGSLTHFAFVGTIGNQISGTEFDTGRIEARDAWDNIADSFASTADIVDTTGSLLPIKTTAFSSGVLAGQNLTITKSKLANYLTVSSSGNQGISNSFNVSAGPAVTIAISDQSSAAGPAVGARTISTDDTLSLFALGYDVYNNYTGAVVGTWGSTGSLDLASTSGNSTISYSPTRSPLSGTIIFSDSAGHSAETGIISVKHGALTHFNLSIPSSNQVGVVVGDPATLTALDSKNNVVADFNASVDNVSFTASTGGNILGLGTGANNVINTGPGFVSGVADLNDLSFVYAGAVGNISITASSQTGKSGSATVSFTQGPLDHFNLLFSPIQKNAVAFTGVNTIQAVDLGNNILAGFNAGSDSIHITVSPSDGVLTGLSGADSLSGTGDFANGVANISGSLIFTGDKGQHIFTATAVSGKIGVSSPIEILPGNLSTLEIQNLADGLGGIVGNQTVNAGDIYTVFAAGYDASHNFIQNQTVSWNGTGVVDTHLSPINGSQTAFSALTSGTGVINASVGNIGATTGTITVNAGAPVKLVFLSYPYDGLYKTVPPPPHSDNAPVIANISSGPIVVEAQDIAGNVVTVSSGLAFGASSSGNGTFSADNGSWSPSTSFSLGSGQNSKTIYYKDSNSGTFNITVTPGDNDIEGDSQSLVVAPVYDESLKFTTSEHTIKAGEITGPMTIELQDLSGVGTTTDSTISIALSSNSPGNKKFYSDAGGTAEIEAIDILEGQSSATIYYKDTAVTQSLVTASASGLTSAYQMVTVNAGDPSRLFISPGPAASDGQNIIQNYSSSEITVQVFDSFNNLVPIASDAILHLSSEKATGGFLSDDTGGLWLLNSENPTLTIKAGQSQGHFYYRDSALGQVSVSVSSQPGNSWTDAAQIETIYASTIAKLNFITPPRQVDTNSPSQVITVETQDITGNAIPVSSDTPIPLITSNQSGGTFSLSASGPWDVTSITIPAGQSSFNFYYKDTTPGTKTIGISETPSLGWVDAIQQIVINAGAVANVAFSSASQTIARNISSGTIIVELQDANGYPTIHSSDLSVNLSTDSATGAFATDNSLGPWNVSSVVIPAGQSIAAFYYRDQQAGSFALGASVSGHSWTATQSISVTEGVIGQLVFTTALQSIALNASSSVITLETEDVQGNLVNVAADTTITLSSNSVNGAFSTNQTNWGIASVVIPAGSHKVDFYYRNSSAGTFSMLATESPSRGWVDGVQQIVVGSVENTISKLKFKTAPQTGLTAVSGGEVSGKITVETESLFGNPVDVDQITYLVVTSGHASARFAPNPVGPFTTSVVLTILPGNSSADFYYMDTIIGSSTLTVSEFPSVGWIDDSQSIEIKSGSISQIAFTTPTQTFLTNTYSGIITIETRDVYGNASPVDTDTVININSTSGTGTFHVNANQNSSSVTSVIIPANGSSASFYYIDGTEGTYALSADDVPAPGWASATQAITLGDSNLSRLVIEPTYALLPTNTSVQMTAVGYNTLGDPIPNLVINWSISNPAAGSITSDGVLTTGDNIGKYAAVVRASSSGSVASEHKRNWYSGIAEFVGIAEAADSVTAEATVEVYKAPTVASTVPAPTPSSGGSSGGSSGSVAVTTPFVSPQPSNLMLFINDSDPETLNRDVKLSLYATNASFMKISEFNDFHDVKDWVKYESSKNFTLSNGYGKKTVYVKYKNTQGDETSIINAIVYYVAKKTTTTPSPTVSNETIKKYNYVIVNVAAGTSPILPTVLSPAPNSYVLENQVTVTGSALPNTIVTIHIHSDEEITVKAVTDAAGVFVYNFDPSELGVGVHEIYVSIDQTGGSLVGPAVSFRVLPAESSEFGTSTTQAVAFTPGLWIFLLFWILVVGFIFFFLYRSYTGRSITIDSVKRFVAGLADINWWKDIPRRLASSINGIIEKIRNRFRR